MIILFPVSAPLLIIILQITKIELQHKAMCKSIDKWIGIVHNNKSDNNRIDCACCDYYYNAGCGGCPVAQDSNNTRCKDTPYMDWVSYVYEHMHSQDKPFQVFDKQSKRLAMNELNYLIAVNETVKAKRWWVTWS